MNEPCGLTTKSFTGWLNWIKINRHIENDFVTEEGFNEIVDKMYECLNDFKK